MQVHQHPYTIDPIRRPVPPRKYYGDWLGQCFTKLYIFLLITFEKVLFLDADMLCLGDFTPIFSRSCPFGTLISGSGPELVQGHTPDQYVTKEKLIYCSRMSPKSFISLSVINDVELLLVAKHWLVVDLE